MPGIQNAEMFGFDTGLLDASSVGLIERDVKIFKVGTFTNSRGVVKTWTADDLDKAVENFYLLRSSNVIPNVPVREDHTISIKDVVGYFVSVRREGDFLIGDWEWSDLRAKEKWDAKKYRNRSLEIGQYVTNDGTKYDPVVLGLAFVDYPAVEGLYRINDHGEDQTMPKTAEEIAAEAEAAQAEADAAMTKATADAEAAAAAQAEADAAMAKATADAEAAAAAQAEADAAGELVGAHRAPHTFRLAGAEVSDHAKVQAHIEELETFRSETIESGRTGFVEELAEQKIITGPQAEKFRGLVLTMSQEQFDTFKEGFEGMAPANLFGRHDLGDGGGDGSETDATADKISILEGIVASHRARGASEESIQKMSSFRELQNLTAKA